MWRVIFEYVRLHNPSSTALPIMVCAEINAGHQLDSKKTVRCHAYEKVKRIKVGDIKGHNWVPICEYDFSDFFVKLLTVKNTLVAISSKPLFFSKGCRIKNCMSCISNHRGDNAIRPQRSQISFIRLHMKKNTRL